MTVSMLRCLYACLFLVFCSTVEAQNLPQQEPETDLENVYAFVGRLVSAEKDMPYETVTETVVENGVTKQIEREVISSLDERMFATYDVLHSIHGNLDSNRISFVAFDHFGLFNFADYDHALLLVGKHQDGYFLHKYQHDTVFKTENGRWAACGNSPINTKTYDLPNLVAEEIVFSSDATFGSTDQPPISRGFISDPQELEEYWNSDVFVITEENAVCQKGIYSEDLFKLRANTVMKARQN